MVDMKIVHKNADICGDTHYSAWVDLGQPFIRFILCPSKHGSQTVLNLLQIYWKFRSLWPTSAEAMSNLNGISRSAATC